LTGTTEDTAGDGDRVPGIDASMKSVEEHLNDIFSVVHPLGELDLNLLDAHGCVLAEDIVAPYPLPVFDNSAMDGYAVRVSDLAGASDANPVHLPVVGDVAAGPTGPYSVQPGLCVRIMTGAAIPPGAEAVVPVEWTDGGVAEVRIRRAVQPGENVRRAGEDVTAGQQVLPTGAHLGAVQVSLLAAVGRDRVRVRPRPRVVLLSTGNELVEPGSRPQPGQIPDSNSYGLTCAAREAGAIAFRVGILPDDPKLFLDTLEDQLIRADCVVTTGGVSVGAYDVVKDVLSRLGTVQFDRVAMQPGMPQGFGTLGPEKVPFFGLPGNPVSAFVSFEVFVRPALRRMLGAERVFRQQVRAVLDQPLAKRPGRRVFARGNLSVRDNMYVVEPVGGSGSHLLAGLAAANALIVLPEETGDLTSGQAVSVMMLERRQQ
jgi:molybdopterin molybdotransferase